MPRPDPADVSRVDVDGRSIHAANPLHSWARASGKVSGYGVTMDFGGASVSGHLSNNGATIEWSNGTKWRKVRAGADRSAEVNEEELHTALLNTACGAFCS